MLNEAACDCERDDPMKQRIQLGRLLSRRESLKLCLAPAGVIAGGILLGCSERSPSEQAGTIGAGGAGQGAPSGMSGVGGTGSSQPMTAGTTSNAGSGGSASQPQAGANAMAGTGTAGTGSDASAGAGGMAGGGGMDASGSGGAAGAAGSGGAVAGPDVPWASGGTMSMAGDYPDPFEIGPAGAACTLYPSQTLGPCYANSPAMREDISDGMTGLPVRLSFLVVRDGCTPVPNATVDIWHSGVDGVYSAFARGTICNPGAMDVLQDMFCRGVQRTDDVGRADFSTIFPGWYRGRAVHIHFTVRIDGRAELTSQLYFEDDLVTEIQAQGEYAARGMRDTLNSRDSTFRSGGASPDEVLMSTAKRPDGVLHAWKVLAIG
jgi:protocatechuate 3,4-dioxygenase beta subunit